MGEGKGKESRIEEEGKERGVIVRIERGKGEMGKGKEPEGRGLRKGRHGKVRGDGGMWKRERRSGKR